jgi:hypothetical protein
LFEVHNKNLNQKRKKDTKFFGFGEVFSRQAESADQQGPLDRPVDRIPSSVGRGSSEPSGRQPTSLNRPDRLRPIY